MINYHLLCLSLGIVLSSSKRDFTALIASIKERKRGRRTFKEEFESECKYRKLGEEVKTPSVSELLNIELDEMKVYNLGETDKSETNPEKPCSKDSTTIISTTEPCSDVPESRSSFRPFKKLESETKADD